MALESGLVDGTRTIISIAHVLLKLLIREQVVFMRENLLVASAQVAHLLVVDAANVAMEIRPTETGEVARIVGAVVS